MKAALVILGVSLLGKQTFAYNNRGSFHLDERSGRKFAQTLREQFRDGDVMGRIGGDEFVVFMKIPNKEILEKKLRGLTDSLHRNITIDAGECEISASIGAAVAPEAGNDFETLYKKADKALYATKKRGKNGFKIEI